MSWQTSNKPDWWDPLMAAKWDDTTAAWDSTDYIWNATDNVWKTSASNDWCTEN